MEDKKEVLIISEEMLNEKIYNIRGYKVMLDFDLAEIYGYTTTKFNQQVKNNIEKFDEDFMFELTKDEFENLMSKNLTSSWGGRRKLPRAFTEQGIYMLMTVLKGDLAFDEIYRQAKKSIFIIDNYIGIKTLEHLINCNRGIDVTIFSDNLNNGLRASVFADFCKEYHGLHIMLKKTGGIFHDRYIVLDYGTDDYRVFLCGASSKDAGARITSINEIFTVHMYDNMIGGLLNNDDLQLK